MILDDTLERVWKGDVTREDVIYLLHCKELFSLADSLRKETNGDIVTFVINRNINFTNLCMGDCKFCAFRAGEGDHGYVLSMQQIIEKVEEAITKNATEVCIQGGLMPNIKIEYLCEMLETIKSSYKIHVHAFSPMEVYHAASNSNMSIEKALCELKKSGLDSMPGTAAEILSDAIRERICPAKISSEQWISIVKTAHRLGIPTTATMMYGHIESEEDRIDHIFKIRELQKETMGFTEFIPLPFISSNTELESGRSTTIDLKTHSIARIALHNYIDNIQASWVKLGKRLAQLTLFCGVNDLGGTLMEENISRLAGGMYGEYLAPKEFETLIRNAGRIPERRTTLYHEAEIK
jgi:FO synthase subunit 2